MLKPSLQLKLGQQLTMTPQLQQAIRLLQLPALELEAHIRELLESNVMLESTDDVEATGTFEIPAPVIETMERPKVESASTPEVEIVDDTLSDRSAGPSDSPWNNEDDDRQQDLADAAGETLQEYLTHQLELAGLSPRDMAIGSAIVDAVNDDGYVTDSLGDICGTLRPEVICDEEEVERVLAIVQLLDPPGVGARSVAECIALQLEQLDPATPALATARLIAANHVDLVATRDYAQLKKLLSVDDDTLETALALVRACHPRPGAMIAKGSSDYVVPDVFVRRTERGWQVELNPTTVPRVRVNQGYANLLGRGTGHAVMRSQLQEARWLLKSLEIRNETLMKVTRAIVERQAEFLDHGEERMQPMILRDIAEAIEMHESTISRITSGKYMHSPRGVFELRYFFSSQVEGDNGQGTSSTAIRAKIRKLIKEEDANAPLSDSRIAEILSNEGIPVARRTVAKYREAIGIGSSNERKRKE